MLKLAKPLWSCADTVMVAMQRNPKHCTLAALPAICAASPDLRVSELLNDTVNTLPILAGLVVDDIVTGDNVGAVLSIVTELASVIDVTAVPALPATSLKVIATATTPSGSGEATVMVAVHASPTHAGGDAARPAIVHTAVPALSASEAVKATVMTLPGPAGVVVDDIVTGDSVGIVLSTMTLEPSVVVVATGPTVPMSWYVTEKVTWPSASPAITVIVAV